MVGKGDEVDALIKKAQNSILFLQIVEIFEKPPARNSNFQKNLLEYFPVDSVFLCLQCRWRRRIDAKARLDNVIPIYHSKMICCLF